MSADSVEELKKTGLHAAAAAAADLCSAGAEDVACDVCTGRKLKALQSFCEENLQPHHQSPAFDKHQLVEPSKNLQENICLTDQDVLTETRTEVDVSLTQPEPKTRAEFLRHSQEIKLDANTAHAHLFLSERNRKVTFMDEDQCHPRHTDRFKDDCLQVLSEDSLTGRCYWEVEWRGGGVFIAVTYENISRSGRGAVFGFNDKSWALDCWQDCCKFLHNSVETMVSGHVSSTVGVYLDHGAGLLSFYSVSDTMTPLHRVHTTFTQPLKAGVWLDYDGGVTAEFLQLK